MADLIYFGIKMPAPPFNEEEEFERYWEKITTGQGAAHSSIEKTVTMWDMRVGFETDEECKQFLKWFENEMGILTGNWRWAADGGAVGSVTANRWKKH
jgi:hypothetical protein